MCEAYIYTAGRAAAPVAPPVFAAQHGSAAPLPVFNSTTRARQAR